MYEPYETDISYRYLKTVVKSLGEPVCLLGGWAVYLQVNRNFKKETARDYIGSRDIDLGFHFERGWTENQVRESTLARSLKNLENLGFKPMGFRYLKEFHTETLEELTDRELETTPLHFVFPLFIDPVVDIIHPRFYEVFRFHPVDEPLLEMVFFDGTNRTKPKFLDRNLWLPKPHILLATKLNSVAGRDKEHKRLKDVADIFALLWFSDVEIQEIKSRLQEIYDAKEIRRVIASISDKEIGLVGDIIGFSHNEIKRVLQEVVR
jgi:hypothetical protein